MHKKSPEHIACSGPACAFGASGLDGYSLGCQNSLFFRFLLGSFSSFSNFSCGWTKSQVVEIDLEYKQLAGEVNHDPTDHAVYLDHLALMNRAGGGINFDIPTQNVFDEHVELSH